MSINPVGEYDALNSYNRKLGISTAIGVAAGTVYSAFKPGWLYKDMPSDIFVKQVSKELAKTMSSDELIEAEKIKKFLFATVEPETDLESLKPMIKNSSELSQAIKANPSETVDEAITRVFSNPDRASLKEELLNLQTKTLADKKADKNTATKLIFDNFDAKEKKLVKAESTSEQMFAILKKSASKVKAKSMAVAAGVAGLVGAAMYLVAADVPKRNS